MTVSDRLNGLWNQANNTKQVGVVHTTESWSMAGAISWMESQQSGSYQVIFGPDGAGVRMVPDNRQAWAAMATGNRIGLHMCATGYSRFTLAQRRLVRRAARTPAEPVRRDGICGVTTPTPWRGLPSLDAIARRANSARWADYPAEIEAMARQAAEWNRLHGIPLRRITWQQVKAGERGWCGHVDISRAFGESDHTDPGAKYPFTPMLARAAEINAGGNFLGLSTAELAEVATNFRQLGPT